MTEQNQVLLGKRKNSCKSGFYGFPGGIIDGAEKIKDCAARELQKETTLIAKDLQYLGVVKEWQGNHNFVHFVYICREWSSQLQTNEPQKCAGWKWFDIDQLPKKILAGHKQSINLLSSKQQLEDI